MIKVDKKIDCNLEFCYYDQNYGLRYTHSTSSKLCLMGYVWICFLGTSFTESENKWMIEHFYALIILFVVVSSSINLLDG